MHDEARAYVARQVADLEPELVIEFGSLDVNGNLRDLFGDAEYRGVDERSGKNVTYVGKAEDYRSKRKPDLVVCCETLEHAADPEKIVASAARILKQGGTFIVTAACDPRAPHNNNGGPDVSGEHYQNVDPADLGKWLDERFSKWDIEVHEDRGDVYATAVK